MTALPLARGILFVALAPHLSQAVAGRLWGHAMVDEKPATAARAFSDAIAAIAAKRDRAAFALLFEHFAPRVKTFMQRAGASPAQAEELAQEALFAVWRKADKFDPSRASASAWIFTIARNLRIDRLRREWRDSPSGAEIPDAIDESAAPGDEFESGQRAERVRIAMLQLAPEQSKVIELSFFAEKPHAEIAAALGIPLGTVKSRIRLAMNRLRELLGDLT